MKTIGLTGGIASGKSSVSRILKHYPEIDADQVSRDVVAPGSPGLQMIVTVFGPEILQEDGALNRARLRKLIAHDPLAQQKLNAIMHPIIIAVIQDRLQTLAATGESLAFVSAALMMESGSYRNYDAVILITAPRETRLKRLLQRDNMDRETAEKLMDRQWSDEKRRPLAHAEITNNGDLQDLETNVKKVLESLQIPWR